MGSAIDCFFAKALVLFDAADTYRLLSLQQLTMGNLSIFLQEKRTAHSVESYCNKKSNLKIFIIDGRCQEWWHRHHPDRGADFFDLRTTQNSPTLRIRIHDVGDSLSNPPRHTQRIAKQLRSTPDGRFSNWIVVEWRGMTTLFTNYTFSSIESQRWNKR